MRSTFSLLALASTLALHAQASDSAANPVVSSAREMFTREAGYMVAAAELMPADKYGYKPTADQWTYGKVVSHVVLANYHVCAMLNDSTAPDSSAITDATPRDAQVAALKTSFDFCKKALDGLQDAHLGDTITFFGGAKRPRARALLELVADLDDHYSQMASYLRLNNLTPLSAKPKM